MCVIPKNLIEVLLYTFLAKTFLLISTCNVLIYFRRKKLQRNSFDLAINVESTKGQLFLQRSRTLYNSEISKVTVVAQFNEYHMLHP